MNLDLAFLGTSGSVPTARRATSATLIRRGGDRLLIDCGEGTQRQLLRSDLGLVDLDRILLTHLHADHVLGLPGMLKTFGLRGRAAPLTIHGPRGTRALMEGMRRLFGSVPYALEVDEVVAGSEIALDGYAIHAIAVDHGVEAVGYALHEPDRPGAFDPDAADRQGVPSGPLRGALQRGDSVTLPDGTIVTPETVLGSSRRGRSVVLTGDTAPCRSVVEAARGADVLVHEATFLADEGDRARETGHSTAADAALAATAAGVRLLVLTHLSVRQGPGAIEDEARAIFPATVVPRDFDLLVVPFPERGPPMLVSAGARPPRDPVKSDLPDTPEPAAA